MKRLAYLLTFFALFALPALVSPAAATGVQGNVIKSNGQPMFPCDIDVIDRATGLMVAGIADSTLPNGNYNLVLPNGRYDISFKPPIGQHIFQALYRDERVNNNILSIFPVLPFGVYLHGRVVNSTGVGQPTTNIRFKTPAGGVPVNVQDDGTNLDGTFHALVDAGLWNVEFIPPNLSHLAPRQLEATDLSGDLTLGDVVMQDGWILTCSVTDQSFFPVANGKITVRTTVGRTKLFTPLNNTSAAGVATVVVPAGSYEVIAEPPTNLITTYATLTQYGVVAGADAALPNFALPTGRALSAHVVAAGTSAAVFNVDLDVDKMLPPAFPRIETPGDFTDVFGNFSVTVATGNYRVTLNPPVATRLLPVRLNNIAVGTTALNMGTIVCPQGHWLDVTVVAEGTAVPVAGANIDLVNVDTHVNLITVGDVTAANGFARIVTDQALYVIKIAPPNANYDTAYATCRTLADTAMTVVMPRKGVLGVSGPSVGGIRLATPWPNPSHAGVNFAFAGRGSGELAILDVSGRRISTPWQGEMSGERTARWDGHAGRGVPNGIYFARLVVNGETSTRRLVIAH